MVRGRHDPEEDAAAFVMGRLSSPPKKRQPPKNLVFPMCSSKTQQGLCAARKTEWKKRTTFNAARLVDGAELRELLDEGHEPLPLQWIAADRNEHLRRPGGLELREDLVSRSVVRGDLEGDTGISAGSPTCDLKRRPYCRVGPRGKACD